MSFTNFKVIFFLYLCLFSFPLVFPKITFADVGSFVYENTVCNFKECCIESAIPGSLEKLQILLDKNVFGQHIAVDIVVNALRAHWNKEVKAEKALTLSFHGLPGSGKNYVANFIADSLFTNGIRSNYIHYFVGRRDFGLDSSVAQHQKNIYNWIKSNLTLCPKQLFIFDEVDKMPPGVLNAIKPLINYQQNEQSIFIFISNIGEYSINEITNALWKKGMKREHIKLEDFENEIAGETFNENGGFHDCNVIRSGLIDYYVPFLPLKAVHVEQCILHEFRKRNILNPQEDDINYFLNLIEWNAYQGFAKSGCKRIPQKVASYVKKYYKKLRAL